MTVTIGNGKMQSFETMKSAKEVSQYLQNVLSRPSTSKEDTYIYRYTKIHYLIDMLNNREMRLGSCEDMNDDFETAVLDRHGLLKRLYYACFTKSEESLAMYKLYGIDRDSVIFRISFSDLERFVTEDIDSELGEKYAPVHNFSIWKANSNTGHYVKGRLYCTAIGYVDPVTNEIKTGRQRNRKINAPFNQAELAGKVKYKCWEYEDEIRLCGELPINLGDKECIAVKVPDNFDSMISVTLCPGFDTTKNQTHLVELRMRGINYQQSAYDPIYSEFINTIPGIKSYNGLYSIISSNPNESTINKTMDQSIQNNDGENTKNNAILQSYEGIREEAARVLFRYGSVYTDIVGDPDVQHEKASEELFKFAEKVKGFITKLTRDIPGIPSKSELEKVCRSFTGLSHTMYSHNGIDPFRLLEDNDRREREIKQILNI